MGKRIKIHLWVGMACVNGYLGIVTDSTIGAFINGMAVALSLVNAVLVQREVPHDRVD